MTDIVGKSGVVLPDSNIIRSVTIPDLSELIAEFWFGVDGPTSKKNRASGGSDLIDLAGAAGGPAYSPTYLTVESSSSLATSTGLDSTITAPNTVTVAVLQRQDVPISGQTCARAFATDNTGIGGRGGTNGMYSFWNGHIDGATDEAHLAYGAADTDFHLIVGTGVIGQVGTVYAYNGGVRSSDTGTQVNSSRGTTTFKIGGFIINSLEGQVDVAWAAVWNRIMTPDQVDDLYASVASWGASRRLMVS